MSRVILAIASCALTTVTMGHAWAADWGVSNPPMFKPAYPIDVEPMEDSIDFEAGLRYFYGMGSQRATIGGLDYGADDASHFLELHGLIEDHSTSTYLRGNLGYAAIIDGEYETPTSGGVRATNTGTIAYAGADFGYLPVDTESFDLGAFVGYQYLNESIDMGRAEFMTSSGGFDSDPNLLEIHGLRLGATMQADINDVFDVRVDAAAIPYAALNGNYGAFDVNAYDPTATQAGPAKMTGHLYGGALEAMVGFKPTENLAIRAGARGYYLTGPAETYFEIRDPANPETTQGFRTSDNVEFFRWGPVIELTGRF